MPPPNLPVGHRAGKRRCSSTPEGAGPRRPRGPLDVQGDATPRSSGCPLPRTARRSLSTADSGGRTGPHEVPNL
eukprot:8643170-Heterocapsa_arctica.AAC.1